MAQKLKITLKKSLISEKPRIRATVEALGLRKVGHSVEQPDNPAVRGMIRKVSYMVEVEEL